jgi:hypothetical protein
MRAACSTPTPEPWCCSRLARATLSASVRNVPEKRSSLPRNRSTATCQLDSLTHLRRAIPNQLYYNHLWNA